MKEIIQVFLKLGCLGFGGAFVTISMMEDECVTRRGWCTREQFARAFALTKAMPGPIATQMAAYLGKLRAGNWGGVIASLCFILPAFVFILSIGVFLTGIHQNTWKDSFVLGMQVASLGVVFQGAWRLGEGNISGIQAKILALISFAIILFKPGLEPLVILFFGSWGIIRSVRRRNVLEGATLILLIWISLKAALLTFGSGLAIVPLLENDVVEKFKWLTHGEFLEGVALGQITPGPVVIAVSWISYKISGFWGAVVSTTVLFSPAILLGLFFVPSVEKKWGTSPMLLGFYQFVIPTVVGAIFAVTLRLVFLSVKTPISFGILCASLVLVFWKKLPPWIVIPVLGLISMMLVKGEMLWKF